MSSLTRPVTGAAGLWVAACIWTLSCGHSAAAPTDGAKVGADLSGPEDEDPKRPVNGALTDRDYQAGLVWRFVSGSPMTGAPVASPRGDLFIGTTQGYVFSIDARGGFRWAYTVIGSVIGQPVSDELGRVFVATTARRVYALGQDGSESWLFRSPVRIEAGLARGRGGELYFVGMDEHLWALSSRAGALFRIALGSLATAGPTMDSEGAWVAVGTAEGRVTLVRGSRMKRGFEAGSHGVSSLCAIGGAERVAVIVDSALRVIEPESGKTAWSRAGVQEVARAGDGFIVTTDRGRLEVLSGDGSVKRTVEFEGRGSAPPVADRSGTIYVPGEDGTLFVVGDDDTVHRVPVAHAPLFTPMVTSDQVIASSGDGTVVGVRLGLAEHR